MMLKKTLKANCRCTYMDFVSESFLIIQNHKLRFIKVAFFLYSLNKIEKYHIIHDMKQISFKY